MKIKLITFIAIVGNCWLLAVGLAAAQSSIAASSSSSVSPAADTLAQKLPSDAEVLAARRQLVGTPLPDFHVTDLAGQPLSATGFKGKVVLLDFWGEGCAPCMVEMPNVGQVYAQYRAQGFEVLGITLAWALGANDAAVKANLTTFVKAHQMPWPEYCAGVPRQVSGPHNFLGEKLRVFVTPANYLVSRDGKIIGIDLFGDDLKNAVAKAVAAK